MKTRTCRICDKTHTLEHYNYQCRKTNRLRTSCRYCDRARSRKDYHDNREDRLVTMHAWKERTNYKPPGSYKTNPIKGVYGMFRDGICYYIGASQNVYRRRSAWVVKNSHIKLDMNDYIWGIMYAGDDYTTVEQELISQYRPQFNSRLK